MKGLEVDQEDALAGATTAPSIPLRCKAEATNPDVLISEIASLLTEAAAPLLLKHTSDAALASLEESGVAAAFVRAMRAAQHRANALGDEFGAA